MGVKSRLEARPAPPNHPMRCILNPAAATNPCNRANTSSSSSTSNIRGALARSSLSIRSCGAEVLVHCLPVRLEGNHARGIGQCEVVPKALPHFKATTRRKLRFDSQCGATFQSANARNHNFHDVLQQQL